MNEKNALTVLIPIDIPNEANRVVEILNKFIHHPMDIILLHVMDTEIGDTLRAGEIESTDTIIESLKQNAMRQIKEIASKLGGNTQSLIVEGIPFLEIIKLSHDLRVDLIAMPVHSSDKKIENLFFGSTTERVLRGSPVPVFCLK
jgi:glycine betaine transporter